MRTVIGKRIISNGRRDPNKFMLFQFWSNESQKLRHFIHYYSYSMSGGKQSVDIREKHVQAKLLS